MQMVHDLLYESEDVKSANALEYCQLFCFYASNDAISLALYK